jgi:cob(I)alamin adenosyltransferase
MSMIQNEKTPRRGLTIVFTGDGKGKTTAALGTLVRACGHGLSVGVLQFIKGSGLVTGESLTAQKMDIDFLTLGDGFTWRKNDLENSHRIALEAWEEAQRWICSQSYDLIVLDEITYLFRYHWLDVQVVIEWLKQNKPAGLHLILTGRYAPMELIEFADLVTEMREIKHPLRSQGIPAQAGIEY